MPAHRARRPARSIRHLFETPVIRSRRRPRVTRVPVLLVLVAIVISGVGPAFAGRMTQAATAPSVGGAGPGPVPSPPPGPGRLLPPSLPPFVPILPLAQWQPGDAGPRSTIDDLDSAIAGVQQVLNAIAAWVRSAREAAGDAIAEIVGAAPEDLPPGVDLELVGPILGLPDDLRRMLAAVLTGWQRPVQQGTPAADHQAYVSASPVLAHDASGIAATAATVAAGSVRQQAATAATSREAAAVAADPALPAAALTAHQVGAALLRGAPQLPSSRAGIELLVAGMGADMQQRADLDTALAERLTVLAQQLAAVSEQLGALGETTAALAARDAERDRRDLDARLDLMDAARAGGQAWSQMLAGAAGPSGVELPLRALY